MKVIGIIPARYDSTRFPGKPLVKILEKSMICWVVEGAKKSKLLSDVIVATDDQRILDEVTRHGHRAVMTSTEHTSGSDRIWEVAKDTDAEIIVNIQGDEPAIRGELIDACIQPFLENEEIDVVTAMTTISDPDDLNNPNCVKVVTDDAGFALYFSRAAIPHGAESCFAHAGIYAYRRSALEKFCALPPAALEQTEKLEQLRGLAAGMSYYMVETANRPMDVNRPEDLNKIRILLLKDMEEENHEH
jgi:3-deoxy-manno-octulosonate cytidylyltransferase (CMP-KDO synthetase)